MSSWTGESLVFNTLRRTMFSLMMPSGSSTCLSVHRHPRWWTCDTIAASRHAKVDVETDPCPPFEHGDTNITMPAVVFGPIPNASSPLRGDKVPGRRGPWSRGCILRDSLTSIVSGAHKDRRPGCVYTRTCRRGHDTWCRWGSPDGRYRQWVAGDPPTEIPCYYT